MPDVLMIVAICRTDTRPYAEFRIYTKKSITTFGGRCDERWKQDATFDSEFCLKGSIRRDYHQRIAGNKPTGASPRTRRLSVIIDKLQRAAAGMVIDVPTEYKHDEDNKKPELSNGPAD